MAARNSLEGGDEQGGGTARLAVAGSPAPAALPPGKADATDAWRHELIDPIVQGLLVHENSDTNRDVRDMTSIQDALRRWGDICGRAGEEIDPGELWAMKDLDRNRSAKDRVLDLGCGDAGIGTKLAKGPNVQSYVGVDKERGRLPSAGVSLPSEMTLLERDLEAENPFGFINRKELPNVILAIRLLDHIEAPGELLRALAQLFPEGGKAVMLVATSNRRYFKKDAGLDDFGTEVNPDDTPASECRDGVLRYLRSRTGLRRLFRDAGFHVYDEASPLLPDRVDRVGGLTRRAGDHAIAPFHIWLLGIESTACKPASMKEVQAWLAELDPKRTSHATAHLLLSSLDEATISGVHWRTLGAGHSIAYKHNVGGRVFIVRKGRFGAYLHGAPTPKVVFDPNEIFGELEVFDHSKEHDRRHVATVRAMHDGERVTECKVLVLPARPTVQALIGNPKVLGNPMLSDLRTKSLETNLRYQSSGQGLDPFRFESPTGVSQVVSPNCVSVVASILALALEADREKGLYLMDGRRALYIENIYEAPGRFLGLEGYDDQRAINGALKYLQAAGIVGLMRPVPVSKGESPLLPQVSEEACRFYERELGMRRGDLKGAAQRLDAAAQLYLVRDALRTFDEAAPTFTQFLANTNICVFLVEAETVLRRFVTEGTKTLFEQTNQVISSQTAASVESMLRWLLEMDKVAMQFWKRRIEQGEWGYDSLGLPLRHEPPLKGKAKRAKENRAQ